MPVFERLQGPPAEVLDLDSDKEKQAGKTDDPSGHQAVQQAPSEHQAVQQAPAEQLVPSEHQAFRQAHEDVGQQLKELEEELFGRSDDPSEHQAVQQAPSEHRAAQPEFMKKRKRPHPPQKRKRPHPPPPPPPSPPPLAAPPMDSDSDSDSGSYVPDRRHVAGVIMSNVTMLRHGQRHYFHSDLIASFRFAPR